MSTNLFHRHSLRGAMLSLTAVVVLVCLLVPVGVGVVAAAETTYMIDDDGNVSYYVTSATDPAVILNEAGLELGSDDTYTMTRNGEITGIIVKRLQMVTIVDGSEKLTLGTYGETVEELLGRMEITLDQDDLVEPALGTETEDGMEITITRRAFTTETFSRTIPHETEYVADPALAEGERRLVTAGSDGEELVTAQVTYENRVEVAREELTSQVTAQPVNEVIALGTNVPEEPAAGELYIGDGVIITPEGDVLTYTKVKSFFATAYSSYDEGVDWTTATGTEVHWGTVAVDPSVIPYGTRMFIVSNDGYLVYGVSTAEDCGGGIKGDRLDLWMPTRAECFEFGTRWCQVYFLG